MTTPVTATMLYDLTTCSHRVTMDLFGDPEERNSPNPFVELLWKHGILHEQKIMKELDIPFLDLSSYLVDEKERRTLEAMRHGEALIYGGRIQVDGLSGNPDLLRKEGDGYIAGDIKSGAAEEGPVDLSKPKKHYAVQLALYTDILERRGLSAGRRGFIWDVNGNEAIYDFAELYGRRNPRTLWQDYQKCLIEAQEIVARSAETLAAFGGDYKHCHWHDACLNGLTAADDLTLIPELGRSKRDAMLDHLATIKDFAAANP